MASIGAYLGLVTILLCSWFYKRYKHVYSTRTFSILFILVIPMGGVVGVVGNKLISTEVNTLLNYIVNFSVMGLGFILIGIWLLLKLKEKNPFWEEQFRPMLYMGIFSIILAILVLGKVKA